MVVLKELASMFGRRTSLTIKGTLKMVCGMGMVSGLKAVIGIKAIILTIRRTVRESLRGQVATAI